jgi:hypothetical protein
MEARRQVAARTAARYAGLDGVRAVALAGSIGAGGGDGSSDVDLYVYASPPLARAWRDAVARREASRAELDNRFFEPGDEWIDAASGLHLDVMFREPSWIEEEIDRVLVRCEARVGASTCFWHNVLASVPLSDPSGWYSALQARARVPYPAALRRAVVARNHPLLRDNLSSYAAQLAAAERRRDRASLCHRTAALLASFFDVLFALNELPHPGEKRLLAFAEQRCPRRPDGLPALVEGLVATAGSGEGSVRARVDALVDPLDALLRDAGLL